MTDRIEKQIDLAAAPERVWRALTDHRAFGTWFGATLDTPFSVGATSRGPTRHSHGGNAIVIEIIVTVIDPPNYFAYEWRPFAVDPDRDYSQEPRTLVEFRIEPRAGGARLTVSESGFDRIPADRRAEALRMNEGGWEAQIRNIAAHLDAKVAQ